MNEISKAEIRKRLGNISQLREILFGEQFDEYNEQLEQYKQRLDTLEDNLQRSQAATKESLTQMEIKLLDKINDVANNLEKSIQYYNLKNKEEQQKAQQKIAKLSQYCHDNIDYLHKNSNINTNNLKIEIAKSKSDLDRDLILFKQQLLNHLESHFTELTTNKISRADLAEVLFELCIKLKGTDKDIDLKTKDSSEVLSGNSSHADLILPETN